MFSFRLQIDAHQLRATPEEPRFHQQHGYQHKMKNHREQEHGPAAPACSFRFQFQDQMKLWLFAVFQTRRPGFDRTHTPTRSRPAFACESQLVSRCHLD